LAFAFGAPEVTLSSPAASSHDLFGGDSSHHLLEHLLSSLSSHSISSTDHFDRRALSSLSSLLKDAGIVTLLRDYQLKGGERITYGL
jgi:hypothetical protein